MRRGICGVLRGLCGRRISKTPQRICLSDSGLKVLRGFTGFFLCTYAHARACARTHARTRAHTCIRGGKETPQNPATGLILLNDNRLACGVYKMYPPQKPRNLRGFMPAGGPNTPLPGLPALLPHAEGARVLITTVQEDDHVQARSESCVHPLQRRALLERVFEHARDLVRVARYRGGVFPVVLLLITPPASIAPSIHLQDLSASDYGTGNCLPASAA